MLIGDAATKLGRNGEHLVGDLQIVSLQISERRDMTLGDDDDMHGPVWLRVVKGENLSGLRDALDGDPPGKHLVTVEVHSSVRMLRKRIGSEMLIHTRGRSQAGYLRYAMRRSPSVILWHAAHPRRAGILPAIRASCPSVSWRTRRKCLGARLRVIFAKFRDAVAELGDTVAELRDAVPEPRDGKPARLGGNRGGEESVGPPDP